MHPLDARPDDHSSPRGTSRRRQARFWVTALVTALTATLLTGTPALAEPAGSNGDTEGVVDRVILGDPESEQRHRYESESSQVEEGAAGRPARVALPTTPAGTRLGDQAVTVSVDPAQQNYVSLVFWGEDSSAYKTMLLVDGEFITYRNTGDSQAANVGTAGGLPDRFFATTTMMPLVTTQGRDEVRLTLRTEHTATATDPSRGYYEVVVHTRPSLPQGIVDPAGTTVTASGLPMTPAAEAQTLIDSYRAAQLQRFATLSSKVDASPSGRLTIAKYDNELRWYAESLLQDWSPAQTPEQQRAALDRIFATIDRYTVSYYSDVRSLGSGGHQSDWGGYYAELGEALYIVENLIADDDVLGREAFEAFLDEPFRTGSVDGVNSIAGLDWQGGELSRGEAWERVLKASFDFARSRLSYISNQVHYTYEGAWKAHEGLRVLGSSFYEGKDRSHEILREIWGISPYRGEEVLVGPDGEDLDLYHSLFNHDQNVEYTDDVLQIVMRGLAQSLLDDDGEVVRREPYGDEYLSITGSQGLLRENRYVGNYGETGSWIPTYVFRTWGHEGDEELNAELLQQALWNLHARAQTRWQGIDADGNRAMYMDQVVDDRNPAYPGKIAYSTELDQNLGLLYASLEQHMAQNADRYAGADWDPYWEYARKATGFVQQQLVDGRYFPSFSATLATASLNKDHRLPETWEWITEARADDPRFGQVAAGVVLPNTNLEYYSAAELRQLGVTRSLLAEPTAWVDTDNLLVSVRDGDTHILASLAMQNYGWSGNGRWHVQHPGWTQNAQVRTQGLFDYREVDVRQNSPDHPILVDASASSTTPPLAQAGELLPITFQPGVGTIERDNYRADTPYSAYPDALWSAYGSWFVAINTTRSEYGNARTLTVPLPDGTSGRVMDLVSGARLRVTEEAGRPVLRLSAGQAVVLRIEGADVPGARPERVDAVTATGGAGTAALSWNPAAGATGYDIARSVRGGRFVMVATGLTDTSWIDTRAPRGQVRYVVVAVGAHGSTADRSTPVEVSTATGEPAGRGWQITSIGDVEADATVRRTRVELEATGADGFGTGDDFNLFERGRPDSLGLVSQLVTGSVSLTGEITSATGSFSGLTLRDTLDDVGRYVAVGADENGDLVLRLRELDSRVNIAGKAGAGGLRGPVVSPRVEDLGFSIAQTPFVRIERDARTHRVVVSVSADGTAWIVATEVSFVSFDTLHAGITTSGSVRIDDPTLTPLDTTVLRTRTEREDERVQLTWNRPTDAVDVAVERTSDPEVASADGDDGWDLVVASTVSSGIEQTVLDETSYLRITARDAAGESVASAIVEVAGYSLVSYVERAREIDAAAYTSTSVEAYLARLDQIAVDAEAPEADADAIVAAVAAARALLVPRTATSFETAEQPLWQSGGAAPASYSRTFDDTAGTARTGTSSLLLTSTDTTGNGSYNLWARTPISGVPRVQVLAGETYRISFWYQLEDYVPGAGVGAYVFVRPAGNGSYTAADTRTWLPAGDTPEGAWVQFETEVTPAPGVDTLEVTLGLRGSAGAFRVDDLVVEPAPADT